MTVHYLWLAMHRHRWLLTRYAIAGVCGITVQTATLYAWISLLGFQETYLLGALIAFCCALVVTFILQKFWTFRDRSLGGAHTQFLFYTVVAILNLAMNLILLMLAKSVFSALGLDFFKGWYVGAQVGIALGASAVSFLLNFFITFKRMKQDSTGPYDPLQA